MSEDGPTLESQAQINLFLIDPGTHSDRAVSGTLVAADLERKPNYVILLSSSEDVEDSSTAYINASPVVVRKSLERLLQTISNDPYYENKYLFNDSVCVPPQSVEGDPEVDQMYLVRAEMGATEVVIGLGESTAAETWAVRILETIADAVGSSRDPDPARFQDAIEISRFDVLEAILGLIERLWSEGHANLAGIGSVRKLSYIFDDGLTVSNRTLDLLFTRPLDVCSNLEGLKVNFTHDLLSSPVFARSSCAWDLAVKFQTGPPAFHQLLYGTRFHDSATRLQDFLGICYLASLELSDKSWMDYHEPPTTVMCRWSALLAETYGIFGLLAEVSEGESELPSWATLVDHPTPPNFVPLIFNSLSKIEESDFRAGGDYDRSNAISLASINKCCFQSIGLHLATIITTPDSGVSPVRLNFPLEHLNRYRTGRKFVCLDISDEVALVPQKAKRGDTVFVFPGFRVPYLLREFNTGDQPSVERRSYRLVGEAYVSGFMYGEAFRSIDDHSRLPQIRIW